MQTQEQGLVTALGANLPSPFVQTQFQRCWEELLQHHTAKLYPVDFSLLDFVPIIARFMVYLMQISTAMTYLSHAHSGCARVCWP